MKEKLGTDQSRDTNFSKSHGNPTQPITDRGMARLGVTGVPGLNLPTGTPEYVSKAARLAEKQKPGQVRAHRIPEATAPGSRFPKQKDFKNPKKQTP